MPISTDQLLEAGIAKGLIARETLDRLRAQARHRSQSLVETAAFHGRFPVASLYHAVAEQRGLPFVDLAATSLDPELVSKIPQAILRARSVLPVAQNNGTILVATPDPDDETMLATIQRILGEPLEIAIADPESIQGAIERVLAVPADRPARRADTTPSSSVDVVSELQRILDQAYLRRASDIHLEAVPEGLRIRMRVDGRLQPFKSGHSPEASANIISRIKVLAGLDIAEQRAAQDGRITYRRPGEGNTEIEIRVATLPTCWGERVTLRILDGESAQLSLDDLGMPQQDLVRFRHVISRPQGMILLTGPTGSGKTTTLYSALSEINQPHLNIITVENPIEYVIPGISQVRVGSTDKITFNNALRSLLRHDPDVLMIGEIRDAESADIALKAAVTGHLVFSTLHTSSACAAVTRLVDMGCEPFTVASCLTAVVAQRLVRRLCPQCKLPRTAEPEEAWLLGSEGTQVTIYEPAGCARCLGSGYCGRIGVFETFWIDEKVRTLIERRATDTELKAAASGDFVTLRKDAIAKVLDGITSLDEILASVVSE
jgi:type IV pilus assembly protein PilB